MNVEQLIHQVKKRPGMYVGCIELEPVVYFIDGFMFNNFISGTINNIEKLFKEEFHDWVRRQLEERYNIQLEKHHNYMFYIIQVSQNAEERLNIFFNLCDDFFAEFHEQEEGRVCNKVSDDN